MVRVPIPKARNDQASLSCLSRLWRSGANPGQQEVSEANLESEAFV